MKSREKTMSAHLFATDRVRWRSESLRSRAGIQGEQIGLGDQWKPRHQMMFDAGGMQFAGVQVECVDQKKRTGEFAMAAYPGVYSGGGVFGAAADSDVRVKCAQLYLEAERKQRVVDPLAELM